MTEAELYRLGIYAWFLLAGGTFIALFFITAPYGRHAEAPKGPTVPAWLGWIIMESPAAIVFAAFYFIGKPGVAAWALFALWELHYVNRSFIFPFRMRGATKPMSVFILFGAFSFCSVNGYLNARWLTALGPHYGVEWLSDPRFLVGTAIFLVGFAINQHSDYVLFHLRKPGETGYKIPRGGLYRWISCPNYFGELVEWSGWAIATWSPAGLAFAVWSAANLVPRAISHHKWYRSQFADYPTERRALVPGVL
jgi:protein-S-isoprenylcysteine O-methyltransferase Ste14